MELRENLAFSEDYLAPDKRYIGNAVQVFFKDGTSTEKVSIDFPIGHRKRREEGIPVLMAKFQAAIRAHLPAAQADRLMAVVAKPADLEAMPISDFLNLYRV